MIAQKESIEAFVSKANDYAGIEYGCSVQISSWKGSAGEAVAEVILVNDFGEVERKGYCFVVSNGNSFTMTREDESVLVKIDLTIPADLFRLLYA